MDPEKLKSWFETSRITFESEYPKHPEPWRQSGMSGPEYREKTWIEFPLKNQWQDLW